MQPVSSPIPPQIATETCPLCGAPLQDPGACSKCDWVRHPDEGEAPNLRTRDVTALILSIVPGAGHVFKGHRNIGLALMLVGVPVVIVFAFAFTMFFGWLMIPAYWLAVGADAFLRKDLRPSPETIGLR